jgi:hypothetical protein
MGPLVLVCGLWVWAWLLSVHHEHEARDDMKDLVAETRSRLTRDAADGTLLGTEIDRDVVAGPYRPARVDVLRSGHTVTLTGRFTGTGPGFLAPTEATGCYRFRAAPPSVSVRQVPDRVCLDLPYVPFRPPAQVADDVVVELRAALARGGVDAAARADVWSTYGIRIARRETGKGRLTTVAWLMKQGVPSQGDCYAFRAQEKPASITAKRLTPQACYRAPS